MGLWGTEDRGNWVWGLVITEHIEVFLLTKFQSTIESKVFVLQQLVLGVRRQSKL
jgi:hypothetical protein